MTPLHALAEMLAPGDTTLRGELDRADDPWEALADGLEKRKRLWSLDWKTFASDVLWALDQILPKDKQRWAWCNLDRYEDTKTTEQFLGIVGKALAASDIGLIAIDQERDDYPVTTLPFAQIRRAQQLAKQTKLGAILSFAPTTKPAPPRPLPPPRRHPPTKRAKQFRVRGGDLANDKHSHARGMIYEKGEKPEVWLAALGSWPPKTRRLATGWRRGIAWGPDNACVIDCHRLDDNQRQSGTVTLSRGGKSKSISLPDGVGVERFAFAGDDLVLFPQDWVYRTKAARTPLILAKTWQPVPGLPKAKPPPPPKSSQGSWDFAIAGVAKTGDGADVILWESKGYERVGAKWVAKYDLGKCQPGDDLPCVPGGDGFYFVTKGELRHVARGGKARRRLSKYDRIEWICAGPEGTLLVATIRVDSKRPAGVVFYPDTNEYSVIPANAFSLRRDDWLEVIMYDATLDLVIGLYEHDFSDATMAPVYGSSLLVLPRRKA